MDPHLFSLQNKKSWKNELLIIIKLIYISLYPTSDMSASKRRRLLSTTLLPTLINDLPQKRFAKAVDNKAARKKEKEKKKITTIFKPECMQVPTSCQ